VARQTGAPALYARRRSPTDPNWYQDAPYKNHLARIVDQAGVRFVLDLHGTAPDRSFGIALGTMEGRSCPKQRDEIIGVLKACGFHQDAPLPGRLDVDGTFTAQGEDGQETITRFVSQKLGLPAAQLELHPLLRVVERREDATLPRPYYGDPEWIQRLLEALALLVDVLASPENGLLSKQVRTEPS
jgi:hypothetical protein